MQTDDVTGDCNRVVRSRGACEVMSHTEAGAALGVTDAAHSAMMSAMPVDVLSERALNRATLARQYLLERATVAPMEVVERLVGLQAQEPPNPYVALWSRLVDFDPDALGQLLLDRKVVRTWVMRGTIHLVTAKDALTLRPIMQPVVESQLHRHPDVAPYKDDIEVDVLLAFARELLAEPHTGTELRAALASRFPEWNPAAGAQIARHKLPLVQVPPRGLWRTSGAVRTTTSDAWLGKPLRARPSVTDVVSRYFAAFGPATVADAAAWSRLTGMREIVEKLRPRLRVFADDRGRELFDVPDAPRPDPDTPAPVRFLPEYDNVLLSHADRTRVVPEATKTVDVSAGGRVLGTILYDGFLVGVWRNTYDKKTGRAALRIEPVTRLTKAAAREITAEGRALLSFIEPDAAEYDVDVT